MRRTGTRLAGAFAACGLLAACQSSTVLEPAVLERGDPDSLIQLKSAVAEAMEKPRVDFGAGDLTTSPEIAVLPPKPGPFETHSLAVPTYFDLARQNGGCVVIERESGNVYAAPGVSCRALTN